MAVEVVWQLLRVAISSLFASSYEFMNLPVTKVSLFSALMRPQLSTVVLVE